jgi:hypothetical protein
MPTSSLRAFGAAAVALLGLLAGVNRVPPAAQGAPGHHPIIVLNSLDANISVIPPERFTHQTQPRPPCWQDSRMV